MKSHERPGWHLLAALTTCAGLVACGGGGGGGGGGGSTNPPVGGSPSPAPSPSPPPPPPPPPGATVLVEFEVGKTWRYGVDIEKRAYGGQYLFKGERVLYAERLVSFQGRIAWMVTELEERREGTAKFGFTSNTRYFSYGLEGLYLWVGNETSGNWRQLLSRLDLVFGNNTFLWAGTVESGAATTIELEVPITVPAGNFITAEAGVHFRESDGGQGPSDVYEDHHEYHADKVGIVLSTWNVEFDDNFGSNGYYSEGTVELLEVGGNQVHTETEPNDGYLAPVVPQTVPLSGYLRANVQISDAGTDLTDANVAKNELGVRRIQDFYRFNAGAQGRYLVSLVDYSSGVPAATRPDLDLYLFREGPGGALTFVSRSTRDAEIAPGGEQIEATLTAGNYVIGVQAWATAAGAAPYWLSVR